MKFVAKMNGMTASSSGSSAKLEMVEGQQNQIELEAINRRFDYILEGAGLGAWDWWLDTNKVIFDRRWCEMLGLKHEETKQELSTWDERVHPDDREKAYQDIKAYLSGEVSVYENIHRMRHCDGRWIWILDRGRIAERDSDGKPLRFVGTHLDITKMKEFEELNRALEKSAKIGAWELDVATGNTVWTDQTYVIHGLPKGSPTNKIKGIEFYAEHERERITKDVQACIAGKAYRGVYDFIDSAGKRKSVEAYGQPVFDADGKVYKLIGTFQDVTDRTERARESFELNRVVELAVEGANLGIWHWDFTTNKVDYSPKWAELRGLKVSDLKMTLDDWSSTTHPEDVPQALAKIDDYMKGLTPFYEAEFRTMHRDGSVRYILGRAKFSAWDNEGKPTRLTGTDFDITELKLAQDRLRTEMVKTAHTAKLASLGELSAGMAHEINNPLAIIMGSAEVLPNLVAKPDVFEARLSSIQRAAFRIEKIVKGLRKFSRTSDGSVRTRTEFASVIREALSMLEVKAKRADVDVAVDLSEGIWIDCDPIEIEQVFVNLIGNGIDAVKSLSERRVEVCLFERAGKAVARVSDNGLGVPVDLEQKIFDPFFTTKKVGEGTGLGLSISEGILESHSGELRINRSVCDSCFEVEIPLAQPINSQNGDGSGQTLAGGERAS